MFDPAVPWTCFECGQCAGSQGACTRCGQTPLLDARDPEIRQGMLHDDELTAAKHDRKMVVLSIVGAVVVGVVISLFVPFWMTSLQGIIFLAGTAFGVSRLLVHKFPARQRFGHLR